MSKRPTLNVLIEERQRLICVIREGILDNRCRCIGGEHCWACQARAMLAYSDEIDKVIYEQSITLA